MREDSRIPQSADPDATQRRQLPQENVPDPDATLRRPSQQSSGEDPGATVRRAPVDPDATVRRPRPDSTQSRPAQQTAGSSPAPQAAQRVQTFPVEIGGRRVELAIEERLAAGGEGELYLCSSGDSRYVAKILQQDSDYEVLTAMVQRASILASRHLVPCLYVGSMEDVAGSVLDTRRYVVHPYYAGGDLAALRNARAINPSVRFDGDEESFVPCAPMYAKVSCDYSAVDEAAFTELVRQLADGLGALHEVSFASGTTGAVHRDIKPQNIFVDENAQYALGDFGLVSAMGTGSRMKFTQRIGLSHGYSPPEAYSDRAFKQTVTRKYDYFSLGMTLLHIAGGRPRYIIDDDLAQSDPHVMTLADFYETIMLSQVSVPDELPRRIRNIIRGLLAADPDDRWGGAEVAAWLEGENPIVAGSAQSEQPDISLRAAERTVRGAAAVAGELVAHWETYAAQLADGTLEFIWDDPEPAYREAVEQAVAAAEFADCDIALQTLVLTIYPQAGHIFAGRRYDTDEALGHAMLEEAKTAPAAGSGFFAQMLVRGALTNAWKTARTRRSDAIMRTLAQIESAAADHPRAALYAAGSMLCGRDVPPLRIETQDKTHEFTAVEAVLQWVSSELEHAAQSYCDPILPAEPPRVPGRWFVGGTTPCLRQVDDSILLGTAEILEPFPVPGALLETARRTVRPDSGPADGQDELLAMLFRAGAIGEMGTAVRGTSSGDSDGFLPQFVVDFLALFPQVRARHAMDSLFTDILHAHLERLRYISTVKLPGVPVRADALIDRQVRRVRGAVRTFEQTRDFAQFAAAVAAANKARATFVKLRQANFEAAKRTLALAPRVMSSPDPTVHAEFTRVLQEHAVRLNDQEGLEKLSADLAAFSDFYGRRARSDISRYLLSDTMLFIRNYNATSPEPLEIVLPDTTDAAAYYAQLSEQVDRHRERLVEAGVVDAEGHVLQQARNRRKH